MGRGGAAGGWIVERDAAGGGDSGGYFSGFGGMGGGPAGGIRKGAEGGGGVVGPVSATGGAVRGIGEWDEYAVSLRRAEATVCDWVRGGWAGEFHVAL